MALIVTIIVLLILAGVSIATLAGNNGLISRTTIAKEATRAGEVKELVRLEAQANKIAEATNDTQKTRSAVIAELVADGKLTSAEAEEIQSAETPIITIGGITIDFSILPEGIQESNQNGTPVSDSSYVGYYIQKDGQYAIIYVDLVGQKDYSGGALQSNDTNNKVSVPSSATSGKTFKSYVVTDTKYTDPNGHFGTNYVIEVAENNTGTDDRFIAMKLSDVDTGNHTWWNWFISNSSALETSHEIGAGKTNTETVKARWESEKTADASHVSNTDIWSLVTLDTNNEADWFIPSNNEWIAFGAMSWTDNADTPVERSITGGNSGNYDDTFELANLYWSSSQTLSWNDCANQANYSYNYMGSSDMDAFGRCRLSTTF